VRQLAIGGTSHRMADIVEDVQDAKVMRHMPAAAPKL
jgi:hypothetical protein